jgi:hypothetical protein
VRASAVSCCMLQLASKLALPVWDVRCIREYVGGWGCARRSPWVLGLVLKCGVCLVAAVGCSAPEHTALHAVHGVISLCTQQGCWSRIVPTVAAD